MRIHPETVALMVTPSENASQNRKNVLAAVEAAKMIGEELEKLEASTRERADGEIARELANVRQELSSIAMAFGAPNASWHAGDVLALVGGWKKAAEERIDKLEKRTSDDPETPLPVAPPAKGRTR